MWSSITFVAAALIVVASLAAGAQQARAVHRIGFLGNSTAALEADLVGPFREGLRELGYVEGQNLIIEYRWAEGKYERFPDLIAELLARKVELIVTAGTPASLAVQKATTSIPLVMVALGDPVATGLVASLARPGGNITGITSTSEELEGKRLELLREVIPKLSRVAVIWNSENPTLLTSLKQKRAAAAVLGIKLQVLGIKLQVLGIKLQVLEARTLGELEEAFKAIAHARPGALSVMGDRLFLHNRQRIMDFATKQRLLTLPVHPELV
jgi:putative ABC transport system substrate-binding protein